MHNLLELQNSFAAAILAGDMELLAQEFVAGKADAGRRLSIFRNNTFASLTQALKLTFPVTVQLADARFFAYAAHEFIAGKPPAEPRLSIFGAEFPHFLATFPPCRNFPIIAAMAALEWAIAEALNEAEETAAPIGMLDGLEAAGTAIRLHLQPGLQFVVSRWPVHTVWSDHKCHAEQDLTPLRRMATRIAIARRGEDIQFVQLDAARFVFWRTVAAGRSMEEAAVRALLRDPFFDLVSETLLLFRMHLVIAVSSLPVHHA